MRGDSSLPITPDPHHAPIGIAPPVFTSYNSLEMDPTNIVKAQQPVKTELPTGTNPSATNPNTGWTVGYKKVGLQRFKGFVLLGFASYYTDGVYAFIVLKSEPGYIRMLKINQPPAPTDPGHSSMVTATQYTHLQSGTLKLVYAGEMRIENKRVTIWRNRSGHFKPATNDAILFANHWGIGDVPFVTFDYVWEDHLDGGDLNSLWDVSVDDGYYIDKQYIGSIEYGDSTSGMNEGYIGYDFEKHIVDIDHLNNVHHINYQQSIVYEYLAVFIGVLLIVVVVWELVYHIGSVCMYFSCKTSKLKSDYVSDQQYMNAV